MDERRKLKANLLIVRDKFTSESVSGKLYLNGEFLCYTLENPWYKNKRNVSCIPVGLYDVRLRLPRESATRDYVHLLVKEVPNRSYILFHIGNTAKDTKGCILTGMSRQDNMVLHSKKAHTLLMQVLLDNELAENIELIIKNR